MSNKERKNFIRKEAIAVIELTKGYNPEQRLYIGNLLTTVEDLADYILELTSDCE